MRTNVLINSLAILGVPLAVSFFGVMAVIAVNIAILAVGSDHYRAVTEQAWDSGTLKRMSSQLLAPNKLEAPNGSDCIFLSMLSLPRSMTLKDAVSPKAFVDDIDIQGRAAATAWYSEAGPYCATLDHTLKQLKSHQTVPTAYYHRYIHGDMTVAGTLLMFFSYSQASLILLLTTVFIIGMVAFNALEESFRNRERGLAFLLISLVLALFYGLSVFDQSFYFAPTDILIVSFIFVGLKRPFCTLTERHFIFVVACFAMGIAVLEFLTGGIPLGLTVLITLIALGEAPSKEALLRRQLIGIGVFCSTIVMCFIYKLILVGLLWGPGEIKAFTDQLFYRMGGTLIPGFPKAETTKIEHLFHLPMEVIDKKRLLRVALVVVSLVYSGFVLGLGSQVLGVLLVALPTPMVIIGTVRRIVSRRTPAYYKMFFLSLLGAVLVCPIWYLAFEQHTIRHSFFMVRPLVWSVALCGVFFIYQSFGLEVLLKKAVPALAMFVLVLILIVPAQAQSVSRKQVGAAGAQLPILDNAHTYTCHSDDNSADLQDSLNMDGDTRIDNGAQAECDFDRTVYVPSNKNLQCSSRRVILHFRNTDNSSAFLRVDNVRHITISNCTFTTDPETLPYGWNNSPNYTSNNFAILGGGYTGPSEDVTVTGNVFKHQRAQCAVEVYGDHGSRVRPINWRVDHNDFENCGLYGACMDNVLDGHIDYNYAMDCVLGNELDGGDQLMTGTVNFNYIERDAKSTGHGHTCEAISHGCSDYFTGLLGCGAPAASVGGTDCSGLLVVGNTVNGNGYKTFLKMSPETKHNYRYNACINGCVPMGDK